MSDVAVILYSARSEVLIPQAKKRQGLSGKPALVLQVVYGEHGSDFIPHGIVSCSNTEEEGDEARLPVVQVYDVRAETQGIAKRYDRKVEECKPFRVVFIPVETLPVKVMVVVDEIHGNFLHAPGILRLYAGLPDDTRILPPPNLYRKIGHCPVVADRSVSGKHYSHIVPLNGKGFRQRPL